ncbi:MAG TPA: hypothetical protein VEL82_04980 [Thermoplasmata archaeon]|nr:hypothetical protein [Thermoplasmata archaeon]
MAVHRAPPALDARSVFAQYPFLPGAEALLGGEPVSIRALLEESAYSRARALGRARVLAGADDPRASRNVEELAAAAPDVRYLSFLFARIVLAAAPSPAALRRWAVAEAKRAFARLRETPAEELVDVAGRLDFTFDERGGRLAIPLVDYLRLAVPIREADFRLSRQQLDRGQVVVGAPRAARLLEEAIRLELARPVPLADDVRRTVAASEDELLASVAEMIPAPIARGAGPAGRLHPEWFPPCIRKMQRVLEAGENLSHSGRFALAAFLHRVGADFETIVDAYRGAPDFDESITRYQVEHITHHDDGQGYTPPECDTLRSHGLCFRDGDPSAARPIDRERDARCFEPSLRHPLQYYRRRGGTVAIDPPEGRATTGPGAAPDRPERRARSPSTARR